MELMDGLGKAAKVKQVISGIGIMKKIAKFCALGIMLAVGSACTSSAETSKRVEALQKKDKQLTCKEILLEMNEAEFYKGMANKNKGAKLKYVLMPLGYISTYMDAEEAIEASNARVSYLNKIYEISGCNGMGGSDTAPANYQQPQQPYYGTQQQMVQNAPQVRYQVQPQVTAPMHPQTAAMPVFEEAPSYPSGYSAY